MTHRRDFLRAALSAAAAGATLAFPPVIRRALAIPAHRRTGTIADVEHVVILMQENRSFDHYFGTLSGVRGFADRFPIPVPDAPGIAHRTVWFQSRGGAASGPAVVAPFRLDTRASFALMRVSGTPHTWPNAQGAWGDGRLDQWPAFKTDRSMGHFTREDLPFQFALAEAFTLCDAYHCSLHGGTNPNRLFLWSGTHDPHGAAGGPALTNDFDRLDHDPAGGYTWMTYPERLQAAGVSWQIYQNMADNFGDNPLAGFRRYRDAVAGRSGALAALRDRGLTTRDLDLLADDAAHDRLPQVSWIIATEEGSEHPDSSSPAQGAAYTRRVLEALTANPAVWSRTVLLVNFDENDGFFDHVPPPAPPSASADPAVMAGASTVDTAGEYHEVLPTGVDPTKIFPLGKPYGLGPRVPMYVISPWSKGGWVNSQVFDHTSVLRFLERRFGVAEPNISAWRRAVCGDLTSAFDFADPDGRRFLDELPDTVALAVAARALRDTTAPEIPALAMLPVQDEGTRPSRALPYELHVAARVRPGPERPQIELTFGNTGTAGAVFHVYDRKHLDRVPRRFTVEPDRRLTDAWQLDGGDGGDYDLWLLGPAGFHRHITGRAAPHAAGPEVDVAYVRGDLEIAMHNRGLEPIELVLRANAYTAEEHHVVVPAGQDRVRRWSLERSAHWYDITVEARGLPGFRRRFAGRVETGRHSLSDPAMGGPARGEPV